MKEAQVNKSSELQVFLQQSTDARVSLCCNSPFFHLSCHVQSQHVTGRKSAITERRGKQRLSSIPVLFVNCGAQTRKCLSYCLRLRFSTVEIEKM
jgi:hypothetical protein